MKDDLMIFNGVNGASGEYDLPPQRPEDIARIARGIPIEEAHRRDISIRRDLDASMGEHYGLREGLDPKELSQSGWGVIFPQNLAPKELAALKEALKPLLDHRQGQAAAQQPHYYKECSGELGYRPGQSKSDFLRVHGRGAGPADPDKLPYYLLIVGDPETIPYTFQYQLDVQYAVGRIHFDKLEDYYRYATSVVQAETRDFQTPRQVTFFGTANQDDRATQLSAQNLIQPLTDYLSREQPDWTIQSYLKEQALKEQFDRILRSEQAPSLLFTASHGMSFPNGDPRQEPHQGALLCQDWPGPRAHQGPIPEDFYFSGDDLGEEANVFGTMAFLFACYGAGTPKMDDFYRKAYIDRKAIAPQAFLSRLPQRMLAHPRGGALAVVGHVERAWGYSFLWEGVGQELVTYESALTRLLEEHPLGSALEYFNSRYAELASDLTSEIDETSEEIQNTVKIAGLWTASNDARNYMILGDPAVRVRAGEHPKGQEKRSQVIELLSQAPQPIPEAPASASQETQRAAPGVQAAPPTAAEIDYGLIENFKQAQSSMGAALGGFVDKLSAFLSATLDEASSLEVSTYASQDMSQVVYEKGQLKGATLRALTRIAIDGDTLICVPERDGEVDTELWEIHKEMVAQAQASRAEMLKTVVSAATNLVDIIKP
jgi:hypothetical protein